MTTPAVSALNLVPVRAGHTTEQALASMVALGINQALHPGLSEAEITTMMP